MEVPKRKKPRKSIVFPKRDTPPPISTELTTEQFLKTIGELHERPRIGQPQKKSNGDKTS